MFNIGSSELLIILILALIILGPGKLPEVGKALGKALGEFKRAVREIRDDVGKDE
ncbi:MAG: twin-arginine translocase TatA/TatE family subunit [Tepidanaerobacteraceae bacterium]|nr:twin-arginine translocase TatA/TatE family subunit [Thermoanaerobacterales bacterium]